MIAITGSAGKTGRAVVRALARRGAPVRALVKNSEQAKRGGSWDVTEVKIADLTDLESLERGLAGSSAVYHICPNMRPDEEEIGKRVIELARRLGIERFVYHSVLHPQIEAMPHHWQKLRVEERLLESGLRFTVLQPAAYMQNLEPRLEDARKTGVFAVPYAATTRIGMVDLGDVAEAAALVLTEPGHDAAIYELAGTERLDQLEVAEVFSRVLARQVSVEPIAVQDWQDSAAESGLGKYATASLLAMFRHYERHGFWGNPRVLEKLLGRPPRRFEDVARGWAARAGS